MTTLTVEGVTYELIPCETVDVCSQCAAWEVSTPSGGCLCNALGTACAENPKTCWKKSILDVEW